MKKCQFHPVFGAGIWTHDFSIMSHLPWTLDQGSRVNVCIHWITWRQKITRSDNGFVERLPPPCANLALTLLWSMSIMFWVKNDKNMVHLQKYLMHLGANLALDTLSTASKYFRTASKISPREFFYAKIAYLWTGPKKKPCAVIAQWVRLRLPSCRPRFESKAHHLSLYHL